MQTKVKARIDLECLVEVLVFISLCVCVCVCVLVCVFPAVQLFGVFFVVQCKSKLCNITYSVGHVFNCDHLEVSLCFVSSDRTSNLWTFVCTFSPVCPCHFQDMGFFCSCVLQVESVHE